jgi:CDP-6-deoxy-D-xylo-4-hexulose-3-dehydrase
MMQGSTRDKLKDVCRILEEEGVEYRLGTAGGGNQALQPYLKKFPHRVNGSLAHANYVHHHALYVGNHPELTEEQIINLCKKLNNV